MKLLQETRSIILYYISIQGKSRKEYEHNTTLLCLELRNNYLAIRKWHIYYFSKEKGPCFYFYYTEELHSGRDQWILDNGYKSVRHWYIHEHSNSHWCQRACMWEDSVNIGRKKNKMYHIHSYVTTEKDSYTLSHTATSSYEFMMSPCFADGF